jgi:hypothetical protein
MPLKMSKTALFPVILFTCLAGFAHAADVTTHVLGAKKQTLDSSTDTIKAGYYAATYLSTVDGDLTAGNIVSTAIIFGFAGTFTSGVTAAAGDILSGKTAGVNGAIITGTLATQTLSAANDTVDAGYYAATHLHTVDTDLATGNIKSGVTIFGILGTHIEPPFCTVAGDKKSSGTVSGNVVYCDNSLRMWTPTAAGTYDIWGPNTNEAGDSCISRGSGYPACNYCDTLSYAGFGDWTLPSCVSHAQDSGCILYQFYADNGGTGGPVTPSWDTNASTNYYWSSTEYTPNTAYAWLVSFYNGILHSESKTSTGYNFNVRCVRAGP